jgi:4-aminobutyrate aminotransferase
MTTQNQENEPNFPAINTPLPGPKTKALIEKDTEFVTPSYPRPYPLSVAEASGCMVTDLDGNRFLDLNAGIAVCSTGHSHPEVVKVIEEQARKFIHMAGMEFYYHPMADLAERLSELAPGNTPRKVFFCNSGAEAVEGAMKLARHYTGRQKFISFFRGFHGRTFGSMSLTASKSSQQANFSPLVPGVYHAHYPYFYRCAFQSRTPEECSQKALEYIEEYLFKMVVPPNEVAAFIIEPIQGEGGYVVPPEGFLRELQLLAERHGILVIADEVQSGVGRTGKMWASELTPDFEPDILLSAKGLASGLPLGAIIAKSHIMNWGPGAHATTFGGNPVNCVAALKTLELVENGLMQNAEVQGNRLLKQLRALQAECELIGEVRGSGLMIGVEFVLNRETREKAVEIRNRIVLDCFEAGLLLLGCGENSIRFSPPLVITADQIDYTMQVFSRIVKQYATQSKSLAGAV